MVLGPANGVRVHKLPVLRVGTVDVETDVRAARGEIALCPDIVAGEQVDGCRSGADCLADAELAVGIVRRGAGLLDMWA
jgi:hypothetical protein